MSATLERTRVELRDLLRDTRHLGARAASDLADWLAHLSVEGKADRTLHSYMREVALLLREHPDTPLEDFTPADITYVLALKPERSRYITRSIFNSFFQWATDQERIPRNPMVGKVPKMRQPKRRPRDIFSLEEVALLESLPLPDGALFTLMFTAGLRRSECRNLRRDHIDLNRARLVVYQGKGDKDRIVPLPTLALTAIADLDLGCQLRQDEYVWALVKKQQRRRDRLYPIGDTTFERWYARAITAAGVRYLNPHQTRHTYGHRLRELGFDIEERQILMGHESIRTTQFYYGRVTVEDVAARIREAGL